MELEQYTTMTNAPSNNVVKFITATPMKVFLSMFVFLIIVIPLVVNLIYVPIFYNNGCTYAQMQKGHINISNEENLDSYKELSQKAYKSMNTLVFMNTIVAKISKSGLPAPTTPCDVMLSIGYPIRYTTMMCSFSSYTIENSIFQRCRLFSSEEERKCEYYDEEIQAFRIEFKSEQIKNLSIILELLRALFWAGFVYLIVSCVDKAKYQIKISMDNSPRKRQIGFSKLFVMFFLPFISYIAIFFWCYKDLDFRLIFFVRSMLFLYLVYYILSEIINIFQNKRKISYIFIVIISILSILGVICFFIYINLVPAHI